MSFIVNYAPDRAVRFDLDGNAIEVLDRAHRIGDVQLFLGGRRPISRGELDAIFAGKSAASDVSFWPKSDVELGAGDVRC